MTAPTPAEREKNAVARSSVLAAVFLTSIKLLAGIRSGSLGILSEAAHSGLDLAAAFATLLAVRASAKPADREHTYGHGKFESLSALFQTFLLLVTCAWIVHEAIDRLFFRPVAVQADVLSFLVILASIAVDASRSRALMRAARKHRSRALEADALHFSTDIWSSAVVLFGLGMVFLSPRLGRPWMVQADSVAALVVAAIVIRVSLRLGKRTLDDLLDAVPGRTAEELGRAARVPGVSAVRRVRVRRSGPTFFADVTLAVPRDFPLSSAHGVARAAERAVRRRLPEADVVVQLEPDGRGEEGAADKIRGIAARHGMTAHAISVSTPGSAGSIEMHLEVDRVLSVSEAHDRVSLFEEELRKELPSFPAITTHIEPAEEGGLKGASLPASEEKSVRQAVGRLAREIDPTVYVHDLKVRREEGALALTFHCALDGGTSIEAAHALTARMETRLREELPRLGRVVIHIEPFEQSGH